MYLKINKPLVSVEWLKANLENECLIVLNATIKICNNLGLNAACWFFTV